MPWPSVEHIRQVFPREEIPAELLAHWVKRSEAHEPVAVACSGGADSVATLLLARAWTPQGSPLLVLHYNHRVRGESSDRDAEWVRQLALEMGLIVHSAAREKARPGESETLLRRDRLAFFQETCRTTACRLLLTGHHLDDVVETFFMRLARGSGPRGLSAPRPLQAHPSGLFVGRPLIRIDRETIQQRLRELGVTWREDRTNAELESIRNRIRHQVIPLWKAGVGPNWQEGVARSRDQLESIARYLEAQSRRWLADNNPEADLVLDRLPEHPEDAALRRQILLTWLERHGFTPHPSAAAFEQLLGAVAAREGSVSWGQGRVLLVQRGRLTAVQLAARQAAPFLEATLPLSGTIYFSDGARLQTVSPVLTEAGAQSLLGESSDPSREAWIALDGDEPYLQWPLRCRAWQPGDRYQPLGAGGTQKLQDAFTNRKVPAPQRSRLPVIVDAVGRIVWVPGLLPAEQTRLGPKTKRVLGLTYERGKGSI